MKNYYLSQKTISKEGSISGVGLHTGSNCSVTVRPAAIHQGIQFLKQGREVSSNGATFTKAEGHRCTSLGSGDTEIKTIEHLLAAISGLGISNIQIDVHGPEIPGLDGSSKPFVCFLKELGIVDQKENRSVYKVTEPIFCYEEGKAIGIYPADEFSISYVLDYNHLHLKNQTLDIVLTPENFESEIAPARTFCTEEEALELKKRGFGLGATYENTLIISEKGLVHNKFRFNDECARHKILDILGDLNLLGFPVLGRIIGIRSGHSLNRKLVEQINKQKEGL